MITQQWQYCSDRKKLAFGEV